ncbi:MAG: hypothetical protein F4118_00930 [Acidimicrobiaceae bacterium]|nr:hypothetical protein [Acidimicrobiaceae bacterium]MYI34981.1 hypothetical protein [Acidimicrobiaceae bacterium]
MGAFIVSVLLIVVILVREARPNLNIVPFQGNPGDDSNVALDEIRELRQQQAGRRDSILRSSVVMAGGWIGVLLPVIVLLMTEDQLQQYMTDPLVFLIVGALVLAVIPLLLAGMIHLARDAWQDGPDVDYVGAQLLEEAGQQHDIIRDLVGHHRLIYNSNSGRLLRMKRLYRAQIGCISTGVGLLYWTLLVLIWRVF